MYLGTPGAVFSVTISMLALRKYYEADAELL
jgi:hypothetical protein